MEPAGELHGPTPWVAEAERHWGRLVLAAVFLLFSALAVVATQADAGKAAEDEKDKNEKDKNEKDKNEKDEDDSEDEQKEDDVEDEAPGESSEPTEAVPSLNAPLAAEPGNSTADAGEVTLTADAPALAPDEAASQVPPTPSSASSNSSAAATPAASPASAAAPLEAAAPAMPSAETPTESFSAETAPHAPALPAWGGPLPPVDAPVADPIQSNETRSEPLGGTAARGGPLPEEEGEVGAGSLEAENSLTGAHANVVPPEENSEEKRAPSGAPRSMILLPILWAAAAAPMVGGRFLRIPRL